MKVSQINRTNFTGGDVHLVRIDEKQLTSLDAIKKIAKDKNMDINITRNRDRLELPKTDCYMAVAVKDIHVPVCPFIAVSSIRKTGTECLLTRKNLGDKDLSVKIFNLALSAMEKLEKKILPIVKR